MTFMTTIPLKTDDENDSGCLFGLKQKHARPVGPQMSLTLSLQLSVFPLFLSLLIVSLFLFVYRSLSLSLRVLFSFCLSRYHVSFFYWMQVFDCRVRGRRVSRYAFHPSIHLSTMDEFKRWENQITSTVFSCKNISQTWMQQK